MNLPPVEFKRLIIAYSEELKKLVCQRHRKPVELQVSEVTNKDKTVQEILYCPKCHLVLEYTKELKEKLENLVKSLQEEKGGSE